MSKKFLITPKGQALWAKVVTPETTFKGQPIEPKYSMSLVLSEKDGLSFQATLQQRLDEFTAQEIQKNPKVKSLTPSLPISPEYDREGKETGNYVVKFKLKAGGTNASGQEWSQRPILVDAKNRPVLKFDSTGEVINKDFAIGNGSQVVVSCEPVGYTSSLNKTISLSLRLKGVQILSLNTFVSGSGLGFEAQDGFSVEQEVNEAGFTAEAEGDEDF